MLSNNKDIPRGQHFEDHFCNFQDSVTVHTKIRPKDVPGTLLNIALLNLGSSDPSLRSAAYNLLCALTQTFDLKIEGQLLETAGLYHKSQIYSRLQKERS